jgi:hypothetical protein
VLHLALPVLLEPLPALALPLPELQPLLRALLPARLQGKLTSNSHMPHLLLTAHSAAAGATGTSSSSAAGAKQTFAGVVAAVGLAALIL